MPKTELDGLPVIEVPDSEEITVAVKPDDMPTLGRSLRKTLGCRIAGVLEVTFRAFGPSSICFYRMHDPTQHLIKTFSRENGAAAELKKRISPATIRTCR